MSIKKLLIAFFLLTSPFYIKAQLHDDYIKATILLNNKEKKEGFIKNAVLDKIQATIFFKRNLKEKGFVKYDTSSINELTIDDSIKYKVFKYQPEYSNDSIRTIARLILRGKASLYKSIYREKDIYIAENKGQYYPLQEDELLNGDDHITYYNYKSNFKYALSGYADIDRKIDVMAFSEKKIEEVIIAYNSKQASESTIIPTYKKKSKRFIFLEIDGMVKNSKENEFGIKGTYRIYFPYQSRSTCVNLSVSYYQYKYSQTYTNSFPNTEVGYKRSLLSIPITIQQNFLNKTIRPYLIFGANLCWVKEVDNNNHEVNDNGFQRSWGVGLVFGAGIEAEIANRLRIKGEYRSEVFTHLPMIGIGYYF